MCVWIGIIKSAYIFQTIKQLLILICSITIILFMYNNKMQVLNDDFTYLVDKGFPNLPVKK